MKLSFPQMLLALSARTQSSKDTSTTSVEATTNSVAPAIWDGTCFYPQADDNFDLSSYPGRWYQVAGTLAPFTAGCKCISALYALNDDGSVYVNNTCQRGDKRTFIEGTATPAPKEYGEVGVLKVQFPVSPPAICAGPNYIVQEYTGEIAIVQASNFSTLFILSRKQQLKEKVLDKWIKRAAQLGTKLEKIVKTDQTNCASEP